MEKGKLTIGLRAFPTSLESMPWGILVPYVSYIDTTGRFKFRSSNRLHTFITMLASSSEIGVLSLVLHFSKRLRVVFATALSLLKCGTPKKTSPEIFLINE